MSQHLYPLTTHLAATSWNQLVALLAAHELVRGAKQTKTQLVETLVEHLRQHETVVSSIAQLDAIGKDALRALLWADGALPVHPFEERFGPMRPYRPWRKDEPTDAVPPWQAPISTTEQLWYLGLIFRDPPKRRPGVVQHYAIPTDLIPALTTLVLPATEASRSQYPTSNIQHLKSLLPHPGRHGSLDHHLTIWLATIHAPHAGKAVKPVHGRWLPPSVVALLCRRLGLDQAAGFTPIKSERHLPYLAFLHYLALAADLIAVTPMAFQLTPTAWAWLNAEPAARRQQILEAWYAAPAELAHPFRFGWEPLSVQARALVGEQLARLPQEPPQALSQVIDQWRLLDSRALLPTPRPLDWRDETDLHDPLRALFTGPLHWLGLVEVAGAGGREVAGVGGHRHGGVGRQAVVSGRSSVVTDAPASLCIMPKRPVNTILASLTVQPVHLVRLARFCKWEIAGAVTVTPHTFTLAADRIGHLAAQGVAPEQLLEQISATLGRPPSRRVRQRVLSWAQAGQQLRLRPLLVLEADTPERLAQLRRHKLVRNRLGETIAPNRIALRPTAAAALVQTLRTLGYYVEPPAAAPPPEPVAGELVAGELVEGEPVAGELVAGNTTPPPRHSPLATPPPATPAPEPAAGGLSPMLQWFLITLYQGLGEHLPLPLDLPWTLRQALRAQLTALQQADAEGAAQQLLAHFQAALTGYLQLPAWTMPATAAPEPIIEQALTAGHDLEIRYWGPADGQVTTRTVTPYWIEERHHTRYLIGWCHLRQQERTFRLDRMEAVAIQPRP